MTRPNGGSATPFPPRDQLYLTDGGLETTLLFHDGIDLACFAAIDMLRKPGGRAHLDRYFEDYLAIARDAGTGFVLESITWRASADWAEPLGLSQEELDRLNREAIAMLHDLRERHQSPKLPIVVSGCIGPRGDGYDPGRLMNVDEARAYHSRQAAIFAQEGADVVSAITMNNIPEATGIALAARDTGIPAVISFTVETDGRLPTGDTLAEAIGAVDAASGGHPAYYMINCAHPSHFEPALAAGGDWVGRIRGIRANASRCSHAELDGAEELDCGNPAELGEDYARLLGHLPHLLVLGGCCGTDQRHVAAIAAAVGPAVAAAA